MTPRQRDVLRFIDQYWHSHGCSPSYRLIAQGVGLKSTSQVHQLIKNLHERGFIERMPGRARSTRSKLLPELFAEPAS
jgi:repressor LexA